MTAGTPKQIVILPETKTDVVAQYIELGQVVGKFTQTVTGEIDFHYCNDETHSWYVNKSRSAFQKAVEIFNKCCALHADDDDTEDEAAWALVVAQLRSEFERIEPLGDPDTSLWSATVHDAEGGLFTLY